MVSVSRTERVHLAAQLWQRGPMDPLTSLVFFVVIAAVFLYAIYGVVRKAVRDELDAHGRDARSPRIGDSPVSDA